jgi:hypothetical protein
VKEAGEDVERGKPTVAVLQADAKTKWGVSLKFEERSPRNFLC